MPRLAANLTMLFTELPLLERFGAAASAGFAGVEVQFPYDDPAPQIADRLRQNGQTLVCMNTPPPNYTGRPRGFAAVPDAEALFRQDFRRALRVARVLGAGHLHVMAGVAEGPAARAAFVTNLKWAAAEAPDQRLTIEPLNPGDMPGYFLTDYDLALAVLDEVGAPNLRLQFDAYHAHQITGDLLGTWARTAHRVGHVQIADAPGRHEPGTGVAPLAAFLTRLDAEGYAGWVGAEYFPRSETAEGLGWMAPWRQPR